MIFTFYRALGMSTGTSMVEEDLVETARGLIAKAEAKGVKLMLPKDVVVADKFAADAATRTVRVFFQYNFFRTHVMRCCVWLPVTVFFHRTCGPRAVKAARDLKGFILSPPSSCLGFFSRFGFSTLAARRVSSDFALPRARAFRDEDGNTRAAS